MDVDRGLRIGQSRVDVLGPVLAEKEIEDSTDDVAPDEQPQPSRHNQEDEDEDQEYDHRQKGHGPVVMRLEIDY
ncbi:hypothetical protein A2753_00475 [Candidatus Uhrbacteria bacterium RIFCSPHIGHO2_01_FULL_47_11]|nr:MAG: hypothetical protein A2753_00475 [Candidatus Uhrbacteria bacterium RIFCSPHIGHO2_01_FULL_47_11]